MALSQNEFQEQVIEELKNALAYFIERQKLVAQVMTELGLDLNEVAEFKSGAWASGAKPINDVSQVTITSSDNFEEIEDTYARKLLQVRKRASERNLPQIGVWQDNENDEWRYSLHGGGCRLTNIKTGEPIDWDCPDVNSFDKYKFFYHLEWQLTTSERKEKFMFSRNIEKDELKSLVNEVVLWFRAAS